jgi:D-aminopeptidase
VPAERKRLRELGYRVGRFATGPRNALVDVPGVRVGHVTLIEGSSVRTGVTAVLPHGGNVYADKVLGACHVLNGYGKATGLTQLAELGTVESPLLVTNTLAVGAVWEGALRHLLGHNPGAGREGETVNVIVTECFDGWLSDARGLQVRPEHALEAIDSASETDVSEGAVGAGTGTTCFGFKSGVGTASRRSERDPSLILGCLVVANYGTSRDRHGLLGEAGSGGPPEGGGSAIVLVATGAPLSERQLRRLAVRAALGLARAGSFATSASGEFAVAFSTAHRLAHAAETSTQELSFLRDDSWELRELFEMAVESTHEAVLNSLCSAAPMEGREGHRVDALPYELLERAPGIVAA